MDEWETPRTRHLRQARALAATWQKIVDRLEAGLPVSENWDWDDDDDPPLRCNVSDTSRRLKGTWQ